jgi:hypothetical protein
MPTSDKTEIRKPEKRKTTDEDNDDQMAAYSEAVKSGLYRKRSGVIGKYDNVRQCWEDEIVRSYLRPHLQRLVRDAQARGRGVRIMDLGCGSADGYELLVGVRRADYSLEDSKVAVLSAGNLDIYKGVDLSQDLLNQARAVYGRKQKLTFQQADLTQGIPIDGGEEPYDLYFSSYGTCSHFNDDEPLINLLADIARRTRRHSVIVLDWLGRYSYEWQTLWREPAARNINMDYVVSYIYERDERERLRDQLQHLYLRLMGREEAEKIIEEASLRAGVRIKPLRFFDRSIFTGRHMDTADYNPHAQSIRRAVNALHEINTRANLDDLFIKYVPREGFDEVNRYFERLQTCWNELVLYTGRLLRVYDAGENEYRDDVPRPREDRPPVLLHMMDRMKQVVAGVGWLQDGLPRENIIEPQLGYALRHLMMDLQDGIGTGHFMVAFLEVDKTAV